MSTMIQICHQVPAEIVRAPYFDFDDPVLSMFVCVWCSEFPVSRVVCNGNRSEFRNQHFDNVCFCDLTNLVLAWQCQSR